MSEPRSSGKKLARGTKMPTGKRWRLVTPNGKRIKASLLTTYTVKGERFAIFHVIDKREKKK